MFNRETKQWEVKYRRTRDLWILLLKTISERVFALPPPDIKADKIYTQYEMNTMRETLQKKKNKQGIKKKYQSVAEPKVPEFQRILGKLEAEVEPDEEPGRVKFDRIEPPLPEKNPYQTTVNLHVHHEQGMPKFTFKTRAFYEQSLNLDSGKTTWEGNNNNPIYKYIPQ